MKAALFLLLPLVFLAISLPAQSAPPPAAASHFDAAAIRSEFEELFSASPIYQAIRKNLPEAYEEFFQSYLAAKRSGADDLQVAGFINSIRNEYLKQSSDESVLAFFRYTVDVGSDILNKDPDAAFAYIFGGDPDAYAEYLDFTLEQKNLGRLYERILSTRAGANLDSLDREQAEAGMDYVNVLLHLKHGKDFSLLSKETAALTPAERRRVCVVYLDMFNEIFALAPATRDNVLRSFTVRM